MRIQPSSMNSVSATERTFSMALWLALLTIVYNLLEGLLSVWFGVSDEALALFGFGVDSFIETISAAGILAMIIRIRNNRQSNRDLFEITALRTTGWGFYILAVSLAAAAAISLLTGHNPVTTVPGLIISVISIGTMWLLVHFKRKEGKRLASEAIAADANCNLVCIYMSMVLLISSLLYTSTGFGGFDALGAGGLVWFSVNEGRESFARARGKECGCHE